MQADANSADLPVQLQVPGPAGTLTLPPLGSFGSAHSPAEYATPLGTRLSGDDALDMWLKRARISHAHARSANATHVTVHKLRFVPPDTVAKHMELVVPMLERALQLLRDPTTAPRVQNALAYLLRVPALEDAFMRTDTTLGRLVDDVIRGVAVLPATYAAPARGAAQTAAAQSRLRRVCPAFWERLGDSGAAFRSVAGTCNARRVLAAAAALVEGGHAAPAAFERAAAALLPLALGTVRRCTRREQHELLWAAARLDPGGHHAAAVAAANRAICPLPLPWEGRGYEWTALPESSRSYQRLREEAQAAVQQKSDEVSPAAVCAALLTHAAFSKPPSARALARLLPAVAHSAAHLQPHELATVLWALADVNVGILGAERAQLRYALGRAVRGAAPGASAPETAALLCSLGRLGLNTDGQQARVLASAVQRHAAAFEGAQLARAVVGAAALQLALPPATWGTLQGSLQRQAPDMAADDVAAALCALADACVGFGRAVAEALAAAAARGVPHMSPRGLASTVRACAALSERAAETNAAAPDSSASTARADSPGGTATRDAQADIEGVFTSPAMLRALAAADPELLRGMSAAELVATNAGVLRLGVPLQGSLGAALAGQVQERLVQAGDEKGGAAEQLLRAVNAAQGALGTAESASESDAEDDELSGSWGAHVASVAREQSRASGAGPGGPAGSDADSAEAALQDAIASAASIVAREAPFSRAGAAGGALRGGDASGRQAAIQHGRRAANSGLPAERPSSRVRGAQATMRSQGSAPHAAQSGAVSATRHEASPADASQSSGRASVEHGDIRIGAKASQIRSLTLAPAQLARGSIGALASDSAKGPSMPQGARRGGAQGADAVARAQHAQPRRAAEEAARKGGAAAEWGQKAHVHRARQLTDREGGDAVGVDGVRRWRRAAPIREVEDAEPGSLRGALHALRRQHAPE